MTTAQVAVIRCEGYEPEVVFQAVGRGLDLLGGAERFVRAGERILLKPNLLVASAPEDAITTHPSVFAAVARHLAAAGATLSYGDSPAFGSGRAAARKAGIVAAAEALGVARADFNEARTVSFTEGRLIKQFEVAASVLDADRIVSLPKMKTHALVRMTGAVKNQFGCIPGVRKGAFHARVPDAEHFAQMLVDLNRLLRPRLFVMDGIVAMEGNGPRGGDPRAMNVLLLSDDPVALDATMCRIVDLDVSLVGTVTWGEAWGLGQARDIELLGDPLASVHAPDFNVNRRAGSTTGGDGWDSRRAAWHVRMLRNRLVPRPVIDHSLCTACGTCVRMCPVEPKAVTFRGTQPAINVREGRRGAAGDGGREVARDGGRGGRVTLDADGRPTARPTPPVHDYSRCIRCYCCQEMCPDHAIFVKTPLLGRLVQR